MLLLLTLRHKKEQFRVVSVSFFSVSSPLKPIVAIFANLADSRLVMATDGSTQVPQDESEPTTVEQPLISGVEQGKAHFCLSP